MLSTDKAEAILKRSTFRLYLGKHPDHRGVPTDFYGTGFFVGRDGTALTACHNFEGCSPDVVFDAIYQNSKIQLKWIPEKSSEAADIAVVRLSANPDRAAVRPLKAAFLDPGLSLAQRRDYFGGRSVTIFGYPERDRGAEGWPIDGIVDSGTPIIDSYEGAGAAVERLCIHGSGSRVNQLEGISGAAILDRQTGLVIGVEGSYDVRWIEAVDGREYWQGAGDVRGSEIAQLVREHPDLARYFERLAIREEDRPALSDREAERRYLEQVISDHQYVEILGGARPLDLEKIYISLRVGEYVPPDRKPDEHSRRGSERTGIIEATEALSLRPCRLAILGDPGSGKTTLLRYLALRIAGRDRALGDWARAVVPSGPARWADLVQRGLSGFNVLVPGFLLGVVALGLWIAGIFHSSSWLGAAAVWLVLLFALTMILIRYSRSAVWISTAAATAVLLGSVYAPLVPVWAWTPAGIALLVLLYPYWVAGPVKWLRRLRDRLTRYPVPIYLTLNDVARSGEPLGAHLARQLGRARFGRPKDFLDEKLDKGECLILLDALDEVMEETAYRAIAEEIGGLARRYSRVPVAVTCRTAGFRDHESALGGFHRLEVQDFTEEQVGRFIRNWFADYPTAPAQSRVEGLLQGLARSRRMRQLAANPLLLSLICQNYERDLRLPERRVELYAECAKDLLEKRDRARGLHTQALFPANKKREALQAVAWRFHDQGVRMFGEGPLLDAIGKILPSLGYEAGQREVFLREVMQRSGLIRQQSRTSYSFAHLTFQEFFTAEQLQRQQGGRRRLVTRVGDPWWREVILLYAGLEEDATGLLRRLKGHDLMLAAAALPDARDPGTSPFRDLAGGIVGDLKALVENDADRRQEAADALAAIGKWGASEYLAERAGAEGEPAVSLAAVLALDRAGDRSLLARLCEPLGPVLRLLTGQLGKVSVAVDERILSLLDRLGFPLVAVPEGEFLMGDDKERVQLKGFWIGKFPVTNALYRRFSDEIGGWQRGFDSGKEDHPAVDVSFHDAVEFCKWSGTILPSEAEWEKAARGTDGRRYPWGEGWDASRCNTGGVGTSAVDAHPAGVSPYGCHDMAGNVWEWTRSHYRPYPWPYPYDPADGREALDAPDSVHRVLRGGAFHNYTGSARCAYRDSYDPYYRHNHLGFRVAASPSSGL